MYSLALLSISSTPSLLLLFAVRLLTIADNDAPNEPAKAAIDPPPGAADSLDTSSIKSVSFIINQLIFP